ncbi:ATP synthase subunit f, mitochondrial [Mycena indigotica]|uniref:ATP synthase subunit f, mitochondrial n=1 Tax=Mycena indigotica TaxID=2126181 RepID=A0A8H6S2W7_9AGAR|nr:ATP synthase subunit f, mitochondrial [Mycena indigotica]KAF7292220.1 ATP synthase subunit f, mitochondrial [Mycena indigotica]
MHASLIRRSLGGLVPPKIATPKLVSGDSAGPLGPLVSFYSKLPKGRAPAPAVAGVKGRLFSGKNASAKPVLALIGGLWLVGYTLDYQLDVQSHPLLSLTLNPVPPSSSIDTVCGQQRMCQRTSREVLLALPPSPTVRSASDERGGAWVKELAEDGTHAPAASG